MVIGNISAKDDGSAIAGDKGQMYLVGEIAEVRVLGGAAVIERRLWRCNIIAASCKAAGAGTGIVFSPIVATTVIR